MRPGEFKTVSEELLAAYLNDHDYQWEYEPTLAGKSKHPDFLVCKAGVEFLCDVKERSAVKVDERIVQFDPMEGIRKKIDYARQQFREFKDRICTLVLFNNGDLLTRLCPMFVFGAMLGEPGISFRIDASTGTVDADSASHEYLPRNGKMIKHYKPLQPHDSIRTISAIVVLSCFRVPNPEFDRECRLAVKQKEDNLGRGLSDKEFAIAHLGVGMRIPRHLRTLHRTVVCKNPFARHVLPENIFNGLYDEQWDIKGGVLQRTFCGLQLLDSEPDSLQC